MSKSNHKFKFVEYDDEGIDENYLREMKKRSIDKRKEKRFNRALKTKNIDELLEYEEDEGWGG